MSKKSPTYRELTENFLQTRSDADFTLLYSRIKPGLRTYVYKIVKDNEIAEDITINTLTKMWTKIEQYDPQYQITTWLYRIAFNASLGYIKERKQKTSLSKLLTYGVEIDHSGSMPSALSDYISDYEDQKTETDYLEEQAALDAKYGETLYAMKNLKEMYRDILVDRMLNGMKYEDLANKYELPLQTIKNRIRRGKALIVEAVERK
jgi:RNA polymerase sigma-70 factor (ECF subfamily)